MTKTARILFIILILSAALFFFSDNEVDPDLWGHLKFGEDIYTSGSIPRFDIYSYTSPGAKWINHEWLSELIFYTVFKHAGGAGLLILKIAVGVIMVFILLYCVSGETESFFLRLAALFVTFSVIGYGFATRPQIFTYLFFTATVFFLYRFENTREGRWLLPLPAIFLLWANMHGGVVAGAGVLFLYCLFRFFKRELRPGLVIITVVSFAATFVNPYGPELWGFLARTISRPRPYIREWEAMRATVNYVDYFAVVLLAAAGLFFSRIKRSPFEVTVLCAAFLISFLHKRHIVLFAVLFCVYIPKYIDSFMGEVLLGLERKLPQRLYVILIPFFSMFFLSSALFFGKTNPAEIEIPGREYPVEALRFMKDNGISGNIFCFFDWSQMCIWELSGNSRVFFDGRYRTVYGDDLIKGYFEVLYGERDHRGFLGGFPETDIMLLHPSTPLAERLTGDRAWIRIYDSPVAVMFIKKNARNEDVVSRFRNGKLRYVPREAGPFYLKR
ncbi:MAG: hypothetical protein U9R44_02505 [Candidatus Omnitrophota bacterium]|nr:hypothetical protein [Candidatus Omnitrophota bacterium]